MLLVETKGPIWSLDEKFHKSWAKTMAARLRTLCRHASNARSKKSAWIQEIWKLEACGANEGISAADEGEESEH